MIVKIEAKTQQLHLLQEANCIKSYSIATSRFGLGELYGSNMTPRGWHEVRAKIGAGQPLNAVFKRRRFTGEIYTPELKERYPARDWILTRILWLRGLEKGVNRLGSVDTMRRFIYIHGCPDELAIGEPLSQGCVRMRNRDIVELFDLVAVGTRILITE